MQIGKRLGYKLVKAETTSASEHAPAAGLAEPGRCDAIFVPPDRLGRVGQDHLARKPAQGICRAAERGVIVLPGSRAGWVEYKLRRDPRLRNAVENGWLLVKFRHVRWLAQNDNLSQDNLEELLALDPLTNQGPADATVVDSRIVE